MLQQALLFTIIPLAAAVASGVVASFWTPGPISKSYIQHFAAGIVLAAVTGVRLSELHAARVRGVPVIGLRARGVGVYPKRLPRA